MTHRTPHTGLGNAAVRIGPGDDAAVLTDGTAVTVDTLVEGVHWDRRLEASDVGYKALAVSVSDLAAMGARPAWAVLSLSLPRPVDGPWIDAFAEGLAEACAVFDVDLVGGDTTGSPGPRVVSITAGGPCPSPVRRSTARPGHDLWVTGWLGLAGAGWRRDDPPDVALRALRRPRPPFRFGARLAADGLATAMMDLSDGLAKDLPRLCAASAVGATVAADALPVHPVLGGGGLDDALCGGEDYELLFAAPRERREAVLATASAMDVRVTRVGVVTEDLRVQLDDGTWPRPAFDHFREATS